MSPGKRPPLLWRYLPLVFVLAVMLAWLGGLLWFATQVPETVDDDNTVTDAIVVLTGGGQRVQEGLNLLAHGKGRKLFISGVYRKTDLAALLRTSHHEPSWLSCCIVLGHDADNTRGNAAETARWMHAQHFHSLRLVTASYHMPRSLLEFRRAMPNMRIIPDPVFPKGAGRRWWLRPRAIGLVISEYVKYLLTLTWPQPFRLAP
ncbi:MAG: YdcF family protein [Stellaceae bacterium]